MLFDLIIIGGGPAGITAGIYAARKKLSTLILSKDFFGQISKSWQVDNYPGLPEIPGMDLMKKLENHLRKFPIEILVGETVISLKKEGDEFLAQTQTGKKFNGRTIILALGRQDKQLGIPGEKELLGKGVSYCSICDAPFFQDKQVAVIGSGNSAFSSALDLARYAKKVFLFEKTKQISADETFQEQFKVLGEKGEIFSQTEVLKIDGDEKVDSLTYKNLTTGKTFQMPISGVFINIGSMPATSFLGEIIKFNTKREIEIDPKTNQTSQPRIFAAGDATDIQWKQFVVACGEGAKAALSAHEYLQQIR